MPGICVNEDNAHFYATHPAEDMTAALEGLGFKAEALHRDHVKDSSGRTHDIVVLGHNVALVRAQLEAYLASPEARDPFSTEAHQLLTE